MLDLNVLEAELNILRQDVGLIAGRVRVTSLKPKKNHVEAEISLQQFDIDFKVDPKTGDVWENDSAITTYARQTGLDDLVVTVCKRILTHEIWHWKRNDITGDIGCPTDKFYLAKNMDAVYSALEKKGLFKKISCEQKKNRLVNEFANLFEDVVVNTNLGYRGESDGLSVVYYDAGMVTRKEYTAFAEGFLRVQMEVWGKECDKELLQTFYTQDVAQSERIEGVVDNVLSAMKIKNKKIEDVISVFRNVGNWSELAYQFAWHLSDLMDTSEKQGGKGGGVGDVQKNNEKISSRGSPSEEQKGGSADDSKKSSEDDGEELAPHIARSRDSELTPKDERDVVMQYYGHESGPPRFMPLPKVLKIVYEQVAREVKIQAKVSEEGFEMPVAPIRYEPFDPLEHDIQDVDFSQVLFDPETIFQKNLNFRVVKDNYTMPGQYTKKTERFPNILFLVDCSGSMNDGDGNFFFGIRPQGQMKGWRVDSKYHYALLGAFGAVKWLRASKIAPYIQYNVVLFSDRTRVSGWKGYHELMQAFEVFGQPEFGGTSIDMSVLTPELNVAPSVILFISDGGVDNWQAIRTNFKKDTVKHLVSYIQIKDKTKTGEDLKNWGVPVYDVGKESDLEGLMIDVTQQSFGRLA